MKNILLIIAITFVSLADAQAEVDVTDNYKIERVCAAGSKCFEVFCIQNYVFIQAIGGGSLVQVVKDKYPMKCNEWKKKN